MNDNLPLIVTLKLDADSFKRLDAMRKDHFPPERNFLTAHLTLFHALPGKEQPAICDWLNQLCIETAPFRLEFPRIRMLGRGVAVDVASAELQRLHTQLAQRFSAWLTAQDRQSFKPHVTVQNKVSPQQARDLFDSLRLAWTMAPGTGEGLLLWQYLGGPWKHIAEFSFSGS
ncbi:MAG TPA: 2'-5' RNA ligase family protein [Noviherbaspirillum sp.]|uniref:2'-5' RNA ligase family protein n=1 Tax=Noviherbaspirillum sp. TaxID=1926288 RepID=UPI002DDC989D|nr:2'-5' RNA ligase family protein [Noviherbaspirillum sp.]HEV2611949.1 2'-5' RNA ligase family protein [Noviherbaspirillum sp.]